ncbi:MAG: flap endonuclease [Deltaproteobacteria bacterium]|nr:flap endonuclease [Deltaproteobacteria bacterium]
MNVHLVDGTFELFRAHFGAPGSKRDDGMEVGAARGWARSLLALLSADDVTHIACAYDHEIESFRNQLFDGYKTGEGLEPELFAQFPLAEEVSEALGVVTWRMVEFEADDALAAGAARYASDPRVDQVLICTPDKDLAQSVVGDRVVTLDRIRRTVRNEDGVREKFGVDPESIPDYLALVGDTADGIPGLPRWGAKSTATVLAHYKHLEEIPDDDSDWQVKVRGAKSLAAVFSEHRDDAVLYRTLATLRTDVPLTESLDDLQWRGAHRDKVESLCEKLGSSELLERIKRWAD